MKPGQKNNMYNSNPVLMSLDEYSEKYVKKVRKHHPHCPRQYSSQSEASLHYERTHFFAPGYRRNQNTKSAMVNMRVDYFFNQLTDIKVLLACKTVVNLKQKRLVVIKNRMPQSASDASNLPSPVGASAPEASPVPHAQDTQDAPTAQDTNNDDNEDTLVLTIGDEVLYDEEF
ncbi:uncharacterized protein LOC108103206 [Drosophila eugracilis]|uniref:uncharacterized protein LOC108103206 n=1 Tax=Drosophila eugracilis TaxID=29029 RepID=UPI0007E6941D|nr:uncharacterized protein LOC108103206 [Drosophila eugracilis]